MKSVEAETAAINANSEHKHIGFRHNIVKVAMEPQGFDNGMTNVIVNNRTDGLKTVL